MGNKKAVICTNLKTGDQREFESAREAVRILKKENKKLKISRANIVSICLGKPVQKGSTRPNPTILTQSGGYGWRYK